MESDERTSLNSSIPVESDERTSLNSSIPMESDETTNSSSPVESEETTCTSIPMKLDETIEKPDSRVETTIQSLVKMEPKIHTSLIMWFQLALHSHGPFLGVLVGADSLLYFRIFDLAHLLGKRNGSAFAKRFLYDLVRGRDVLPSFQIFPTQTEWAQLVPRDVAYRILYRENVPMAERVSNALDTGWAYVMGPRLFERSYKPSPKLVLVETPHEHTVNVSQWIREFITDVERQRELEMQLLKQYLSPASLKPRVDETKEAILNIQREMKREGQNDETRDETMEASGDETRDETEEASRDETRNETRESSGDETRNETREESGDETRNETRRASGDETMEETMGSPRENFFQMVT
ncbi:hypothetical protein TNCT_277111 [Trichonephila clavata]|uniref:Uncharacterized protein n=1 Tax=Trichonephila clavata TaxID=2740835 RepID=A0A8X6J1P2_TRICU|nr:hypothetical protein TNCT_277111 [Trichonephila clavata]